MHERDLKLKPYLEAIPDILKYQIATKLILGILLFLLGRLFRILLNSTGRVAVSTGDFTFLFGTWQGILIILIAVLSLFFYVALDLNAKIIMSKQLLMGEDVDIWRSIDQAIKGVFSLFNLKGLGVIIYIALVAPLVGIGLSISLTEGFRIPTFIASVIASTPLYLALASIAVIIFISIGIANLFIMHGMVLDKLDVVSASRQSRKLVKENGKDYLNENIMFILSMGAVLGIITGLVLVLPLALTYILPLPGEVRRGATVFFLLAGVIVSLLAHFCATPFYVMKMTQLYYKYTTGEVIRYRERQVRIRTFDKVGLVCAIIAVIVTSIILNNNFDRFFPLDSTVKIIAHRGGGVEGAENTVSGLEKASQIGAYGSEIDIQRTKDGYYILNHDGNFARVAGDKRKPEEMTLAEIRKLSVDGEPIPTFEEILDASKGKIILFTELKGETADKQMCDDAVRIIKERDMVDDVVLISLKYNLIDYIETNYPEMQTGYLTFASFGDTSSLNCDYLALEEEAATADAIKDVHKKGKKVLVWTANDRDSQHHFFCSSADAVITDNVVQATEVIKEIHKRSDLRRIVDRLREFFS